MINEIGAYGIIAKKLSLRTFENFSSSYVKHFYFVQYA